MTADAEVQAEITDNPLATETRGLGYIRVEMDGDFYYADEKRYPEPRFIDAPPPPPLICVVFAAEYLRDPAIPISKALILP